MAKKKANRAASLKRLSTDELVRRMQNNHQLLKKLFFGASASDVSQESERTSRRSTRKARPLKRRSRSRLSRSNRVPLWRFAGRPK